ncbi:transcriptional regulator [Bacillus sp. Y1]|jgi:DNA-binding transcriptional ArsR family regulator|nr:metalloregulator ArsR/SmtB family transcription factor [Bacillus sp. Y1]AYA75696.1 transcriptional regulator [Bacillus sp. Y1]
MSAVQKHDVFQAIADPTRRKILMLLAKQDLSVTAISDQFPITRTAVSKHLRILSESNLVGMTKAGREKIYKLHPETFTEIKDWLSYFDQFWDNKLSMLKYLVEEQEK